MQHDKAWGLVTTQGGDQVIVNTAKDLKQAGGAALLGYAAYQCGRSGLD